MVRVKMLSTCFLNTDNSTIRVNRVLEELQTLNNEIIDVKYDGNQEVILIIYKERE